MKQIFITVVTLLTTTITFSQNNYYPTNGNVGINQPNPGGAVSPLHVVGGNVFSSAGWRQGITLSDHGTLAFSNANTGGNSTFFMGAPSGSPLGDFYFGTAPSTNGGAGNGPVVYAYSILGQNTSPGLNQAGSREKATTMFRTNTFLAAPDGTESYLGINTVEAKRVLDVHSKSFQLRLTKTANNILNLGTFTDFDVQNFGYNIRPMQDGNERTVFIHKAVTALTEVNLNVNGNGRFRYIPQGSASSLILGRQNNGDANDLTFRRLEFTGNTTDVLLGNGTWGPAAPTITANNGLSLDATGLIVQFGNNVGLTTAQLLNNREIPMNNFNTVFTDGNGQAYSNSIGLGTNAPKAKLHIVKSLQSNENEPTAFLVQHSDIGIGGQYSSDGFGVKSKISGLNDANYAGHYEASGAKYNYGVYAFGNSGAVLANAVGVYAKSVGSAINVGVYAEASPFSITSNGAFNAGIQAKAESGLGNAYGGHFTASSGATTANSLYGIYAQTNGNASSNNWAGWFNGNVTVTGTFSNPSDINMKTNINDYDSSLYVINLLEPKTFEYTNANYQGMSLATGHQYGLIAQEVEQVVPSIVTNNVHPAQYDSLGNEIHPAYDFKGVDYTSLIPILLGGIKEQQTVISSQDSLITDLNDRLTSLESCLSNILPFLCSMNHSMIESNTDETQSQLKTFLNLELKDEESIILEQNVPNPFAEQTTISYTVPASVQKAQIHFYNQSGKLINTIDITERGTGQINVFASDLSSGIYTYTLVADGQIVATKRMVKTN